ncbi:MAG: GPP34 family phosphoprotein [Bacteroidetes bacterium]|nr:MAG: GPP34 family phosphoprotein [Bacteroidota bacterium]
MNQSIPLTQKLYLLGIHPEKGGLISASYSVMNIILIGALFLELFLNKHIRFEDKRVVFLNDKTTDPLHRFLLEKLKQKQNPVKVSTWISKLHFSQKHIRREVQKGLVDRRIIKMEPHQFLFFKWQKSKIINKQPLFNLISEIEHQIFRGTENEEEIMMLSMLKPAGLIKRIFPEKEKRKRAEAELKNLMVENQVSTAVSEAIAAAQAVAASVAVSAAVAGARR